MINITLTYSIPIIKIKIKNFNKKKKELKKILKKFPESRQNKSFYTNKLQTDKNPYLSMMYGRFYIKKEIMQVPITMIKTMAQKVILESCIWILKRVPR